MTHQDSNRSDLERLLAHEPDAAELREAWDHAAYDPDDGFPQPAAIDGVWKSIEAFVDREASRKTSSKRYFTNLLHSFIPQRVALRPVLVAAMMLIAVSVGALALWSRPIAVTAPLGERITQVLPDGSQIELNSGTTLRYARRFATRRDVFLDGEAFFDVVTSDIPFVVETFNARITVLGTRFNVKAWDDSVDPSTTVALQTGRVALEPDGGGVHVELNPGETKRIGAVIEAVRKDSVAVAHAAAWRNGDLVFKDQLLGVILEDVERRFAVETILHPQTLRQKLLTFASRNPDDPEAVIREICVGLNLNYRETANGFEIFDPIGD